MSNIHVENFLTISPIINYRNPNYSTLNDISVENLTLKNIIFFPLFNYSLYYNSLLVVQSIFNLNFKMKNINLNNIQLKFGLEFNNIIKYTFSNLLYIDSKNAMVILEKIEIKNFTSQ